MPDNIENGVKSERPTFGETVDIAWHISQVGAWMVLIFIRKKMGSNKPGFYALGSMAALQYFAGTTLDRRVMTYFWLWLAMLVYRRVETFVCEPTHTQSPGWAWVTGFLPGDPYLWEIPLVFLAARLMEGWCKPLSFIWYWAAGGMTYIYVVQLLVERARINAIKDGEFMARQDAQLLNKKR